VSSVVKDVDVFRALRKAGHRLAEIHVHYEQHPEYVKSLPHAASGLNNMIPPTLAALRTLT
jgi:hypothetical protein